MAESSGGKCHVCGERSFMPYKCRYCGNIFCPNHRLPENHSCDWLRTMKETPRWRDYAAEVHRREMAPGRSTESWDREEERGGRIFGGRSRWGSAPWSSGSKSGSMKRYLVTVLIVSLILALLIRLVI